MGPIFELLSFHWGDRDILGPLVATSAELDSSWIPVGCLGEAAAAREAVITSPELFENVFSPEEPSLLQRAGRPKQEDLWVMVS